MLTGADPEIDTARNARTAQYWWPACAADRNGHAASHGFGILITTALAVWLVCVTEMMAGRSQCTRAIGVGETAPFLFSCPTTIYFFVPTPGALCAWYTSNSTPTKRGALMVYAPSDEGYWTWYVALAAGQPWHITRTKGISQTELQRLEQVGTGAPTA